MPIPDVMPVSDWRDIQCLMVRSKNFSDFDVANKLMAGRKFKYAQSFMHLRGAIEFLFKNLEMEKRRVIFPKYICGSVTRAAERAGIKVSYCDVNSEGVLNYDELKKMPLKDFGGVFFVRTFGNSGEGEKISELCKENKLFLIEDCAHSVRVKKTYGDFVLFHFAKRVANSHGGLLISESINFPALKDRSSFCTGLLSVILKIWLIRPILNLYRSTKKIPKDNDENCDKKFSTFQAASEGSKRLFVRRLRMIDNCENIYKAYFENLPGEYKSVLKMPVYDFFNFPILVPKDKNRDEVLAKLRVYGVFADRIWYNSQCSFAKRVLILPVNKFMNEKDVKLIRNLLKNV